MLGGAEFVESITERFLKGEKDRERPALKKISNYRAKDVILGIIVKEAGKHIEAIAREKGFLKFQDLRGEEGVRQLQPEGFDESIRFTPGKQLFQFRNKDCHKTDRFGGKRDNRKQGPLAGE